MSLPSLPDLVVERIIHYAVLGEYAAEKKDFMDRAKKIFENATDVLKKVDNGEESENMSFSLYSI